MEELNQLVVDYLRQEHTDFAIMINGEWGCGKTYYIAHRLSDIIKSIDSGGGKKYTPAIISLYGVSSSEDFYCKVFFGLNQWAKAKWFGVANTAISIVAGVYGADTKKEDWAKLVPIRSNTVLVFDDMERICTDKISYKEILGLINSYAEQENRKVIIVCNEAEICKNDGSFKEEYQLYKEKTIRFTYNFYVYAEEVFDSLLSQVVDGNYRSFLASKRGIILHLFQLGGKCNYRTLKFIFDILAGIYSVAIEQETYREKLIRNLIVSLMIYAMEYKNSIPVEQLKSLKQREEFSFNPTLDWLNKNSSAEDDKEKKKSISQIMKEKYGSFFIDDMQQLSMLVDYITTGYINREKLIERLNELAAEYQRQEETPEMKVYSRLKSLHTMEDSSVNVCIKEMIGYVENGNYSLCDIMHVYALLLKYDYWHIEDFSLTTDIDGIFVKSLENKATSHLYDSTFEMSIPVWDDTDKTSSVFERYNNLRELAIRINQQSYKESLQERASQLLQSAEMEKVDELVHFREIKDVVNMSAEMDWKRVCHIIENAPNNVACEFIMCIEYLLRHDYNAKTVDLSILQNWIDQYIGENKTHIRKMYVVELKSVVESIYK